jgi:hypothetical protein
MTRLVLAIGLAAAVAINVTAIAIQAPSFEGRWGPFPKPTRHRSEAACSWVADCRPT